MGLALLCMSHDMYMRCSAFVPLTSTAAACSKLTFLRVCGWGLSLLFACRAPQLPKEEYCFTTGGGLRLLSAALPHGKLSNRFACIACDVPRTLFPVSCEPCLLNWPLCSPLAPPESGLWHPALALDLLPWLPRLAVPEGSLLR